MPPEIASKLEGIKPSSDGYIARCPAHDDNSPSLSVTVTETGKVLLHCHANCDQRAVLDAINVAPAVLDPSWEPPGEHHEQPKVWTPRGDAVDVYSYVDEHGVVLFEVCRTADKQFPQRKPDPAAKSGWTWKLGDTRRVLYRLPQVLEAVAEGKTIWVAEGEKDVHSLELAGVVATCSPGGAGKWKDEYAEALRGADVVIVADKDKPGQAHARAVAVSVGSKDGRARICEAATGKDATDHLKAGGTLDSFLTTHAPDEAAKPELALDIHDYMAQQDEGFQWLIPNLIERGDRIMITAFEGYAKSTLLRQMAACAAAGVHPFTGARIKPLRVVFVDCENSDRQTRRAMNWILPIVTGVYDADIPRDSFFPLIRPEGIDLGTDEDAEWLLERVTAHKPDLLIIGPVYRLLADDANTDVTVRKITAAIDRARVAVDCAVILEAHAGHGGGFGQRSTRPLGSSMWMRWVESGIGLAPFKHTDEHARTPLQVVHWKPGRDREFKHWPDAIRHGFKDGDGVAKELPWVEDPLYGPDGEMVTA